MAELAIRLLKKFGIATTGPLGWIASFIMEKILSYLAHHAKRLITSILGKANEALGKKQDKKDLEKYEDVVISDKPTTIEEVHDSTTDLLNGR